MRGGIEDGEKDLDNIEVEMEEEVDADTDDCRSGQRAKKINLNDLK